MLKPRYHTIKEFEFQSGKLLPEITLEYATQGVKETDEAGKITNAILYLHGWTGSYASVENLADVIGPGKTIDTNRFYVISPTALGSPGSVSPSTSGKGPEFPDYTIKDMVEAHYQLINQKLGIEHLKGIMGTSMGGFQALTWALEHPGFTDFLILNGTTHRISNQMYGVYHLLIRIIEDDPGYNGGKYSKNPVEAMAKASNLTFLWTVSPDYFDEFFSSRKEFLEFLDEMGAESSGWDANDVVWRSQALLNYDLEGRISQIKTPALILGIHQDQLVNPDTGAIPLHEEISGSELFLYDSILGHYGCTRDIKKAENAIKTFLTRF
jgi:homoserine O-acetyltransferase